MQDALRDDALSSSKHGFELRVALPWIRSLPVSSLRDLTVEVDGKATGEVGVIVGDAPVKVTALSSSDAWWYAQDRIVIAGSERLAAGRHQIVVSFGLLIPYLFVAGEALTLPFRLERSLELDHDVVSSVSLDVT